MLKKKKFHSTILKQIKYNRGVTKWLFSDEDWVVECEYFY